MGSLFCIFHALSFERNFFFHRSFPSTFNTFMSIAEQVRHLKVVSVLYSLEVKPSFLIKSLTF